MITYIETFILSFSEKIPLEIFVFLASILEEVIAPVPSPTVMLTTGALARIQEYVPFQIILLILIASLGKTIGGVIVYGIADFFEDILVPRFGKYFGITHEDVEGFGKRFKGDSKDYLILTSLRAFPFIPSVLISAGSGLLKIPLRVFVVATFMGTIVRDGFYFVAGYAGFVFLKELVSHFSFAEDVVQYIAIIALVLLMGFFIKKRRERKS